MSSDPVFADTGALIALSDDRDQFHQAALHFLETEPSLITSSWVIEEFIAYLHSRVGIEAARKGVHYLEMNRGLQIEYLNSERLSVTFRLFLKKGSGKISIVDVSNVVIMKELKLRRIFAFDQRFSSIFGLTVVPQV